MAQNAQNAQNVAQNVKGRFFLPHPLWVKPRVVLASQFDGDPGYAKLVEQLTADALRGEGDIEWINTVGDGLLPRPHYPVKLKYIEY